MTKDHYLVRMPPINCEAWVDSTVGYNMWNTFNFWVNGCVDPNGDSDFIEYTYYLWTNEEERNKDVAMFNH